MSLDENITLRFGLAVLATWRVTHLLANEDGPGDIVVRVRARLGQGFAGKMMDCFHCLSLWIAAPAALFVSLRPLEWMFCWLAVSGAACLLERLGQQSIVVPNEHSGSINNVLQSETIGATEQFDAGRPTNGVQR